MTETNNRNNLKTATAIVSDAGYPLPIEMRPIWRIGLICIAIKVAGNNNDSIKLNKLRVFLWMLIRPNKWDSYYSSLHYLNSSNISIASDKSTETAIELAIIKGFVKLDSDLLTLESQGLKLLTIIGDLNTFQREIDFLQSVKSKVTDKYIKKILGN